MPKAKKVSKKSAAKAAPPAPAAKVEVPVQEVAPSQPAALNEQFASLLAQLQSLRSQLTTVTTQVRTLSKRYDRELKTATKNGRKKRKTGNRAPSGFVKPTRISNELADFLNKPQN